MLPTKTGISPTETEELKTEVNWFSLSTKRWWLIAGMFAADNVEHPF